ncbi:heat shock 70 kDa protein 16 [Arachis stenosperma]|uniref:heat shock 70 kDa protein 16 n=1 Tax=Arachis stenosperma TaxID=217475 RepID=UPI0025AC6821|nr:heat shock 70 kDa protein 16 [Arachis stenosperma]XP_057758210.1 heat shock 70 kDa protein 16 [Arachis stenosperma]XP_057758212.1 heat shock 70 kDa protein 16 [Arachis stenosperma]XP_057758213.1 heat shock 70 kDa protein 16 [Arachis stenosperma]XP_057758214.1 heat shock 70 kDa protein 16 [Arachis stenosperma]XP_057758215.1 heat shock 70 kDa protein 16 [Arachis stenosperma]
MSAVGFDIGNENCVIAVVKQRGIDVLLNDESKRETPSVVCFGEKQRFLGSAAAASAMMHLKSTVSQVKRLIGRKFVDDDVERELKMLPIATSQGPDGGILIHLEYLNRTHMFTPVQIMSMLLAHLKTMTEKDLGLPVSDCVIGIPSYFNDLQRRAYLDAAKIAGLKPLRLIHDCTATALSYGIYKTDIQSTGSINVAFIDIGHCDTQVSIAAFEFGQMKILSHASDRSLGGRDFDEVLFNHFAAQFKEKYNIDVYSNSKASIRLRAACEKLKKVLSANLEAPLNIECLMDEKDVKGFITREEFEKLASELLERVSVPCKRALVDANLTAEKISSVELVGSGSRIPAIAKILTCLFKKEPSRKLNASECVARGCALQCAMLHPNYRVREYEVRDSFPFSVGLSSDEGPVSAGSNNVLFPKGHPIPSVKVLTLHRTNLFNLEAFYANQNELPPGASPKLGCFTIGPFQGSNGSKTKVKVRVRLDLHGIVSIESATLIRDQVGDSVATGDYHSNSDPMDVDIPDTVANGDDDTSADGARKDKPNRRLNVPVSENIDGAMSKAEISEAYEKELQLAQQDRTVELTKEKKNTLESYVYDMRNKLFNTYRSFATDQERDDISKRLQETEEWLYEDGYDETELAYTTKLEDLKKLVDPIENRYKDEEGRDQARRDLLKCILELRGTADSLPPQDKELVLNECNKAEQWLSEKMQQQESWPKNIDPIFWSSDIQGKAEDLKITCQRKLDSRTSPMEEDVGEDKPDASNQP